MIYIYERAAVQRAVRRRESQVPRARGGRGPRFQSARDRQASLA